MSLGRTLGAAVHGVSGLVVEIESDLSAGLPSLSFTGLADKSVVEARDRIRAAVLNSGVAWPNRKITVALLPADLRKVGSRYDLGMAVAVLASADEVRADQLAGTVWIAELGLDGRLRPVGGVLPAVLAARRHGLRRVVVAPGNGPEAALVSGIDVRVAGELAEVVRWLRGEQEALPRPSELDGRSTPGAGSPDGTRPDGGGPGPSAGFRAAGGTERGDPATSGGPARLADSPDGADGPDLAEVAGQAPGRRALEVAAAGGHHLYLVGPPGAGKTMLAERLPGLLPRLSDDAALEVTAVHSVAGRLAGATGLIHRPPLYAPHHTASVAALVGGGSQLARPGAVSLAHRGVLFLDEAPEFAPAALEALRQPLETGEVVLHRSGGAVSYPARFQLVLAANPCPCGSRGRSCVCAPQARRRYQQRLSGPLLDRIDLRVEVEPSPRGELLDDATDRESSATVAARVERARAAARGRWAATRWQSNAEIPGPVLRSARWRLPRPALGLAEGFLERGELSARGFDRVLRVAWTAADLAGRDQPGAGDVAEALFFRMGAASGRAA